MTAIAAANSGASYVAATTPVASSAVAETASPASAPAVSQPPVTGSFGAYASSAASAARSPANSQPAPISASADQISKALEAVNAENTQIWVYNHIDWNTIYKLWGEKGVKNAQTSLVDSINGASAAVAEYTSSIGMTVISDVTDSAATSAGSGSSSDNSTILPDRIITGTVAVEPFKFNSDGSTYSETTNTAGQIVGTKDGQAWQTWGMPANNIPSTSSELAALLASFQANDAAAASSVVATANTAAAKIDLSA